MKASYCFSNNVAPVCSKILSSTIAHIVQTASWTLRRAILFFSFLYGSFIQTRESNCEKSCPPSNERQGLQQSLGHLLQLWGKSLSAPCVHPLQTTATGYEPASAVRDKLSSYKEGTVWQGGICCCVKINEDRRGDLLMVGGIEEGGL